MHRLWLGLGLMAFVVSCGDDGGEGNDVTTSTSSAGTEPTSSDGTTSDGTTGAATDSTTTADPSESTGSTGGSSTGGEPEYYTACEMNEECDAPLICNTLSGFCTSPCEDTNECTVAPATGDATPTCSMTTQTCVLSCFDGETCPDGMTCEMGTDVAFCLL